jgi:hypothetical protein
VEAVPSWRSQGRPHGDIIKEGATILTSRRVLN